MAKLEVANTGTEVEIAKASAAEITLLDDALKTAKINKNKLKAAGKFNKILKRMFKKEKKFLRQSLERERKLVEALPVEDVVQQGAQNVLQQDPGLDAIRQQEFNSILGGTEASDEQRRLIGQGINLGIQQGSSDISNFAAEQLEQIRNVLAPGRGLRPTDTPILDRAGKVAETAIREQASLVRNLRAQEAQSLLEFPLQANEAQSQRSLRQQDIGQGNQQFQQNFLAGLLDNATAKRLGLQQQQFSNLAGLSANSPAASVLGTLGSLRQTEATTNSSLGGVQPLLSTISSGLDNAQKSSNLYSGGSQGGQYGGH